MIRATRSLAARVVACAALVAVAAPAAFAQQFDEEQDRKVVEAIQKGEARPEAAIRQKRTDLDTSGWDAQKYTIRYDVNYSGRTIAARVTVDGRATRDGLAEVVLDFAGFTISSVTVDAVPATIRRENGNRLLRVPLTSPLAAGQPFSIEVVYSGTPVTSEGLGFGFYNNGAGTFAEPEGARLWYPCKDRPSDKAQYEGFITVPDGFQVASNGRLVEETVSNGKRTFHWLETHQIATYLISLAIADYAVIEDSYRGIPIRHYAYRQLASAARRTASGVPSSPLTSSVSGMVEIT